MTPVENFYPLISPQATGVPQPVMAEAVRQSARRFFEAVKIWRHTDCFQSSATIPDMICAPADASVNEIEAVRFNGRQIQPISVKDLNDKYGAWREMTSTEAMYYTQLEPDTIRLYPLAEGDVEVDMILRTREGAKNVPDFLFNHYRSTIAKGALAYIYMIPAQTYTSPDMAMFYKSEFESELGRYATDSIQGQQMANVRTKPFFF